MARFFVPPSRRLCSRSVFERLALHSVTIVDNLLTIQWCRSAVTDSRREISLFDSMSQWPHHLSGCAVTLD